MKPMKYLFIGMAICFLAPYLYQVMDLLMSHLGNKQALSTARTQKQLNEITAQQSEEKSSCIGFRTDNDEECYEDEEE